MSELRLSPLHKIWRFLWHMCSSWISSIRWRDSYKKKIHENGRRFDSNRDAESYGKEDGNHGIGSMIKKFTKRARTACSSSLFSIDAIKGLSNKRCYSAQHCSPPGNLREVVSVENLHWWRSHGYYKARNSDDIGRHRVGNELKNPTPPNLKQGIKCTSAHCFIGMTL